MTMHELLQGAGKASTLLQSILLTDPRAVVAIQLIATTLTVVESLDKQGIFDTKAPIELNNVGLLLIKNIQDQLDELNRV